MKQVIDEVEWSFQIWDKILYGKLQSIMLDIFYNEDGHPKHIHDAFGASAINEFRLAMVNEILSRNSTDDIFRISGDAFAIAAKDTNCDSFVMYFRGIKQQILKKTILINPQTNNRGQSNRLR